jgi:hypothetical protein
MSAKQIIEQIDSLSPEDKVKVYSYIEKKLNSERKKNAFLILEKLRGRGKNFLNLEPQDYIRASRTDDRI